VIGCAALGKWLCRDASVRVIRSASRDLHLPSGERRAASGERRAVSSEQ
jgi:hypothetical protein